MCEKPAKGHMAWSILKQKLTTIAAKRSILTHMSDDMLARVREVAVEAAYDGMIVTL